MLKKAGCILLLCGMIFSMAACKSKEETMYIEPAQLSEEEKNIGNLLGVDKNHVIYDFAVGDDVQTMEVNVYRLVDGKWDMISKDSQEFYDRTGRLALSYDKIAEGVRIALQNDAKNGSASYEPIIEDDFSKMTVATNKLDSRTELVFEKEMPLVLQIMTSKNEIRTSSTEQFFEPDMLEKQGHEYIYAITVRFSKKTIPELDTEQNK